MGMGIEPFDEVQVRMAQARERRAQQHLVRARLLDVDVLDHSGLFASCSTAALIARLPGAHGAGIEASVAQAGRG